MKLNLGILSRRLKEGYRPIFMGKTERKLTLPRPLLYEVGTENTEDTFFVARGDMLPEKVPAHILALVSIGSPPPSAWQSTGFPILVLPDAPSYISVYNEIGRIYDWFDNWERELLNALPDRELDLVAVIRLGVQLMNNPLMAMNSSLQTLFSSAITNVGGRQQILVDLGGKYTSRDPHIYDKIKECCTLERQLKKPFISSMIRNYEGEENVRAYCTNLFLEDNFAGFTIFSEMNSTFSPYELPLADFYFPYLHLAMYRYLINSRNENNARTGALVSLLRREPLSAQAHELLSLPEGAYWLCYKLAKKNLNKHMPRDYMCSVLNVTLPDATLVTEQGEHIYGLLKLPSADYHTAPVFTTFVDLIRRMGYRCSVSLPFRNYRSIHHYLPQADFVLDYAEAQAETDVACFDHYQLDYMLHNCFGKIPFDILCSEGLKTLIDYDKQRNAGLLKTLNTYLLNEGSLSKTSSDLYIHRTSLLKRLDKIKKLTDCDLEDPDTRLYYRICLAWMLRIGHHF